jgi:hypothetical protein
MSGTTSGRIPRCLIAATHTPSTVARAVTAPIAIPAISPPLRPEPPPSYTGDPDGFVVVPEFPGEVEPGRTDDVGGDDAQLMSVDLVDYYFWYRP